MNNKAFGRHLRTGKTRKGRHVNRNKTHPKGFFLNSFQVPAIELVSLVHPAEHARNSHKQAWLESNKNTLQFSSVQFRSGDITLSRKGNSLCSRANHTNRLKQIKNKCQ